jgi:LytS/YehU family sensor histidine kinase
MILSLSDLLHYQLRTETALQISLEEEIKFLENYIYFEKRRLPETMQVVFNQSVDKTKRIAPNLLMPVIENAFKHGVLIQAVGAITIDLRQTNGILQLNTMNPIAVAPHHHSGIGLANLRKRLDFLYGKKYKLELERKEQIFYASLQLQL